MTEEWGKPTTSSLSYRIKPGSSEPPAGRKKREENIREEGTDVSGFKWRKDEGTLLNWREKEITRVTEGNV